VSVALDRRTTAEQAARGVKLRGRHAIVTGANTGIGLETVRVLALCGAQVTMACRNADRARVAREGLIAGAGGRIDATQLELAELDLASLASVRAFAAAWIESSRPIHLLINNAGVMLPDRRETRDGFEAHLGVNHLGHFLLTVLLLDRIRQSAPARIVNVASDAMHFAALDEELTDLNWETRRFSGMRSYGSSKLMNLMFAGELNRRYGERGVAAYALHPGIVKTELARDQPWWMLPVGLLMWPFMKGVDRGAATTVYAATAPELERAGQTIYFSDCAPARTPKLAGQPGPEARLWQRSAELVGLGERGRDGG